MKMLKAALLASAIALAAGSASAANLIVNGGFNVGGTLNGSFQTVGNFDSTTISGWTVFGSVDWITGYWQSSDGDGFSIDMDGLARGFVHQDISTVVGQRYNLTFDISGNPDAGPDTDFLSVALFGAAGPGVPNFLTSYSVTSANNHGAMNWSRRSYAFTASAPSVTISFASANSNLCCYGAAIDNVAVNAAVPEPATWGMMVLGFGAAGSMIRRRKAVSAAA